MKNKWSQINAEAILQIYNGLDNPDLKFRPMAP
jgi:hypothetical protein